jgi:hypothetical protein
MNKFLTFLGSFLFGISHLSANTYILKDGTTYNGKVSFETDDSYYLLVEVQPGIRNEVAVKKADIEAVISQDDSAQELKKLEKLIPAPDLLSASEYERAISNIVEPFIKKYPKSKHIKAAKEIHETLTKEHEQVLNGHLKIDGEFLSKQDREANAYEIDAVLLSSKISKLARSKKYDEAFARFAELETDYKNTLPFKDNINKALKIFERYELQAKGIVKSGDEIVAKRDKAFQTMTPSTRIRTRQALADEERAYQARLAKAKASGTKWLPLNRFHPEVAENVLQSISSEKSRLQKIANGDFIDAGEMYRQSVESLEKNDLDAATSGIRNLSRAKVPDRYLDPLEKRLDTAIRLQRDALRKKREEERANLLKAKEEERDKRRKEREALLEKRNKAKEEANNTEMSAEDKIKNATGLGKKQQQMDEVLKHINPSNN